MHFFVQNLYYSLIPIKSHGTCWFSALEPQYIELNNTDIDITYMYVLFA